MDSPILEAEALVRSYRARGLVGRGAKVRAVDGVSLAVAENECVGLVGESGSGKSTVVRLLLGLERPDAGRVRFAGYEISAMPAARVRPLRRRFQAVFQDPYASLDPRLRVATSLAEPLAAHGMGGRTDRLRRATELLTMVGLSPDLAGRRPTGLSGGERQRVALARALATNPDLLILDEPLSALDQIAQAHILELIARLRDARRVAVVLVSHDLDVVAGVSSRVLVMLRGRVVEEGATALVLGSPRHPWTRDLVARSPRPEVGWRPQPPAAAAGDWPQGACRYAPWCDRADAACQVEPGLMEDQCGRAAACWHPVGAEPTAAAPRGQRR